MSVLPVLSTMFTKTSMTAMTTMTMATLMTMASWKLYIEVGGYLLIAQIDMNNSHKSLTQLNM